MVDDCLLKTLVSENDGTRESGLKVPWKVPRVVLVDKFVKVHGLRIPFLKTQKKMEDKEE